MKTRIVLLSVLLFFFTAPGYSQEVTLRVTDDGKLCAVSPAGAETVLLNHFTESWIDPVLCGNVVFYAMQGSSGEEDMIWGAVDLNGNRLNLIDKQEYGIAVDWDITGEPYFPEYLNNTLLIPAAAMNNGGVQWVVTDFTGKVLVPGYYWLQTHEGEMIVLCGSDVGEGEGDDVYFYDTGAQKIVNTLKGFMFFGSMGGGYSSLRDGLLVLWNGEKLGVVDKYGKTVIPFIYEDGGYYDPEKGCFIFYRNDVRYCVDKTGKETVAVDDEF